MTSISYTTAAPPAGSLTKFVGRLLAAWRARQNAFAMGGMGERERQDIGWGQPDRYSRHAVHRVWRNT